MATGNTNSLHLLLEQEVIANPTLDGTEDNLTGLQVDGTKYKVESGGGGHLYRHLCQCKIGTNSQICFEILNNDNAAFSTFQSCATYLKNNGKVMASGYAKNGTTWTGIVISALSDDGTYIGFEYINIDTMGKSKLASWSNSDFTDTVTQIL